jgi:hypothetical protein
MPWVLKSFQHYFYSYDPVGESIMDTDMRDIGCEGDSRLQSRQSLPGALALMKGKVWEIMRYNTGK